MRDGRGARSGADERGVRDVPAQHGAVGCVDGGGDGALAALQAEDDAVDRRPSRTPRGPPGRGPALGGEPVLREPGEHPAREAPRRAPCERGRAVVGRDREGPPEVILVQVEGRGRRRARAAALVEGEREAQLELEVALRLPERLLRVVGGEEGIGRVLDGEGEVEALDASLAARLTRLVAAGAHGGLGAAEDHLAHLEVPQALEAAHVAGLVAEAPPHRGHDEGTARGARPRASGRGGNRRPARGTPRRARARRGRGW